MTWTTSWVSTVVPYPLIHCFLLLLARILDFIFFHFRIYSLNRTITLTSSSSPPDGPPVGRGRPGDAA
jgi:hypothetical protein